MRGLTATEALVATTLAAKPFYRTEQGPVLVRILDQYCQSQEHRRRVCEAAVTRRFGDPERPEDRCPGPAELIELCAEVPAVVSKEASPDCRWCHGDGFEILDVNGVSASKRCRCFGHPMSEASRMAAYRAQAASVSAADRNGYGDWLERLQADLGANAGGPKA